MSQRIFEKAMRIIGEWDEENPTHLFDEEADELYANEAIDISHVEFLANIIEKMADHCVALQHKNTIDQRKFNEAVRWLLNKDVVDDRELAENIVRTIADIFDNTLQRDDDKDD